MIKFNTPAKLNGTQLRAELNAAGVKIASTSGAVMIDGNGDLWLDIATKDETKAKPIVDAHIGIDNVIEPSVEKKLASVGLTIEDLKVALGL
jgi:hypothetical protein